MPCKHRLFWNIFVTAQSFTWSIVFFKLSSHDPALEDLPLPLPLVLVLLTLGPVAAAGSTSPSTERGSSSGDADMVSGLWNWTCTEIGKVKSNKGTRN